MPACSPFSHCLTWVSMAATVVRKCKVTKVAFNPNPESAILIVGECTPDASRRVDQPCCRPMPDAWPDAPLRIDTPPRPRALNEPLLARVGSRHTKPTMAGEHVSSSS